MTSIQEICRKHPDQWVAVRVTEEKEDKTVAGEVLAVADDFNELHDRFRTSKSYMVDVFFTGGPLKEGQAVLF